MTDKEYTINPKTGRFIMVNGPTYRKLYPNTIGKVTNPVTGRMISIDGVTFRKVYPYIYNTILKYNKSGKFRYDIVKQTIRNREIEDQLKFVQSKHDKLIKMTDGPIEIKQLKKALDSSVKSFRISIMDENDPLIQLHSTRESIRELLVKQLESLKGLKYNETLEVTLKRKVDDRETEKRVFFNAKTETIINKMEIHDMLQSSRESIMRSIGRFISEGSGWTIRRVNDHYVNLTMYKAFSGSSYIQLPVELRNPAKGLINLQNKDECCFAWCHVRHLNPQKKNPQRIKKCDNAFIKDKIVNYDGIQFPVSIKDYNKIEKMNSININVFAYEDKRIFPIYKSKERFDDHMELLLISEGSKRHYVLINDFNKLMYNQTKHKDRKHFCMACLQCFSSERILNNHTDICYELNGTQAIRMPTKDNCMLKFTNYEKQQPVPFVIYADFESILKKVDKGQNTDDEQSYTEKFQHHEDCSSAYKLVCCYDDNYSKPLKIFRGKGAVHKFLGNMLEEVYYCKEIARKHFNKPLKMTDNEELSFKLEKKCHICGNEYANEDIRVRDHCHITGKYRGSAHQHCNLKLRIDPDKLRIPIVFHNLKGYDSHLIMQYLGKIVKEHKYENSKGQAIEMNIGAIPSNMEKYMSFFLGKHLVFIDSFQFMSSSLSSLVSNLSKEDLIYTSKTFKGKKFDLMMRKGVYCYDYVTSHEKFNLKELPAKGKFYSQLNNESISDDDYNHAKRIWKEFKCKNLGMYHDIYLISDVLLLADVYERFRKTCLEYYRLDPAWFISSPSLAWNAMLKMTNIQLELMTDVDMHQFIEKGIRGGISYIAHRHSKANNKYMKGYNKNEPSSYVTYLDANSLYSYAMSQYLPTGNFKWLKQKEIDKLNLSKYTNESKRGLILEVDLEYPKRLHNIHNEYPLAAEKINVTKGMLSPYCRKIADKYGISIGKVKKLIPNLRNKEKYVLHYRNLKLYNRLGLKVKKIRRALEFDQSPWLKKYIDFNVEKRKNANNPFEKDYFKLMMNSVFGNLMENLRKRIDVKLVTSKQKLLKLSSKPTFVSSKIFTKDLIAVHKVKEVLTLDRPIYVGMSVLDLSKTLMYDFHYNYIKEIYGKNSKLLFTDTDSLTYEIKTNDVYKDFWNDRDKFDNSDYPKDSKYYDNTNKKIVGKFKDETKFRPINEFVGLKSKMYSYVCDDNKVGKTAKGIKKNVIKNDIKFEDYKETLFNNKVMHHKMKTIRSINHQLGSYEINKISLSCFDDKRYIHKDGISSYAYGHYMIDKSKEIPIKKERVMRSNKKTKAVIPSKKSDTIEEEPNDLLLKELDIGELMFMD